MRITVICNRESYRRAGLGFVKGKNVVEVTEEQLAQVESDPNLSIKLGDVELDDETATLAEALAKVTDERDEALALVKELTKGVELGVKEVDELNVKLAKANAEIEKLKAKGGKKGGE